MAKREAPKDCIYKEVCGLAGKKDCSEFCQRYIQTQSLISLSNLPPMYQKITPLSVLTGDDNKPFPDLQNFKRLKKIKENIVQWVENGQNLYICSTTYGNAKTTWAVNLMLKYFTEIWQKSYGEARGIYVSVPNFVDDMRRRIDKGNEDDLDYIDYIRNADLVIWDDLGFSQYATDYQKQQLMLFIDSRLASGKSNIYTSNITEYEDLVSNVGGRVASRVFHGSEVITFYAKDYRQQAQEGKKLV